MDLHQEERNELAEDEEKLQIALQQVTNDDWFDYDDEEEPEDHLLIDLDAPSDETVQSTSSGYVESGSRTQFMTIDDDSQDHVSMSGIGPLHEENASGTATTEKTLALNRALQDIIESRIESIQDALEINKEKQANLNKGTLAESEVTKAGKGRTFGPFRSPYFNSHDALEYPPDNSDTILKRQSNELQYSSIHEPLPCTLHTKRTLKHAIVEDTKERLMKPIMNRLDTDVKKADELRHLIEEKKDDIKVMKISFKALNSEEKALKGKNSKPPRYIEEKNKKGHEEFQQELEKEEEELKKMTQLMVEQKEKVARIEIELHGVYDQKEDKILQKVDNDKVDWMKISKQWFKDGTSWLDCQKAWEFIANPQINQKSWTKDEESQLLELVGQHPSGEWDLIAKQLKTDRTPFHCFYHYQNRFNPTLKSRPWSKDEDTKLLDSVKRIRATSSLFSWGKVSALINSRSSIECSARYNHIGGDRAIGRWSSVEDARLVMAVDMFGQNWRKVSKFIGKRSPHQCKERYMHCLDPELNFFHFSYEEDKKLLRLYKEFGNQWMKLTTFFKGRTDAMLKNRHVSLERWKKQTEWFEGLSASHRNLLLGENLPVRQRKEFNLQNKSYLQAYHGVGNKDYRLQNKDRMNGTDPDIIPPRPPLHFKYAKFQRNHADKRHLYWTRRLNLHQQLLKNLKTTFENENKISDRTVKNGKTGMRNKNKKLKQVGENELTDEEKRMKDMMDQTFVQTASQVSLIPQQKLDKMLLALNMHFLSDSSICVSEIIKTARVNNRVESLREAQTKRKNINCLLKKVLARNKWIYLKSWKCRFRLLPNDYRRIQDIEAEGKNYRKYIPGLMLRRLGGDSLTLMQAIRTRSAKAEEERQSLGSYKQDSNYKKILAAQQERISEVESCAHIHKGDREKMITSLTRKKDQARREYAMGYALKRDKLCGILEETEADAKFIDSAEEHMIVTDESFLLLNCSSDAGDPVSLSTSFSSMSSFPAVSPFPQAASFSLMSDTASSPSKASTSLPATRITVLEDLTGDRGNITTAATPKNDMERGVTYSSLSYLPPTRSTLTALRALLLTRKVLMKTAGRLYNPDHYKRKRKQHLHIIIDSDDHENEDQTGKTLGSQTTSLKDGRSVVKAIRVVNEVEEVEEEAFTGSWFKTESVDVKEETNEETVTLDQLISQPSHFEPYILDSSKHMKPCFLKRLKARRIQSKNVKKFNKTFQDNIPPVHKFEHIQDKYTSYELVVAPSGDNVQLTKKNPNSKVIEVRQKDDNNFIADNVSNYSDCHREFDLEEVKQEIEIDASSSCEVPRLKKLKKKRNEKTGETKTIKKSNDELKNVVFVDLDKSNKITHYNAKEYKNLAQLKQIFSKVSERSQRPNIEQEQSNETEATDNEGVETEVSNELNTTEKSISEHEKSNEIKATDYEGVVTQVSNELNITKKDFVKNCVNGAHCLENNHQPYVVRKSCGKLKQGKENTVTKETQATVETRRGNILPPMPPSQSDNGTEVIECIDLVAESNQVREGSQNRVRFAHNSKQDKVSRLAQQKQTTKKTGYSSVGGSHGSKLLPSQNKNRINTTKSRDRMAESNQDVASLANVVMVSYGQDGKPVHHELNKKPLKEMQISQDLLTSIEPEYWAEKTLLSTMTSIRQTDQYKRLLARFRALFMWPVLMSTIQPKDEVELVNVTEVIEVPEPPPAQPLENGKRRRGRPLRTAEYIAKRKETRLFLRQEKLRRRVNGRRRIAKDYSKLLPKRDKVLRCIKKPESNDIFARPHCEWEPIPNARKERPQWWKDAVIAAMMKQRDITSGKELHEEMDISQDDDFQDKGNYSDDEWLTEMQEEERKKGEKKERKKRGPKSKKGLKNVEDQGCKDGDEGHEEEMDERETGGHVNENKERQDDVDENKERQDDVDENKERQDDVDENKERQDDVDENKERQDDVENKERQDDVDENKERQNDVYENKERQDDVYENKERQDVVVENKERQDDVDENKERQDDIDENKERQDDVDENKERQDDVDASKVREECLDENQVGEDDFGESKELWKEWEISGNATRGNEDTLDGHDRRRKADDDNEVMTKKRKVER